MRLLAFQHDLDEHPCRQTCKSIAISPTGKVAFFAAQSITEGTAVCRTEASTEPVIRKGRPGAGGLARLRTPPRMLLRRRACDDHDLCLFTPLGQSIRIGIGEVWPEATKRTLDHMTKKEGRHPHLLGDKALRTSRSDVQYRRTGGRSNHLDKLVADIETTTDSPRLVDPEDLIARASTSGDASTHTRRVKP